MEKIKFSAICQTSVPEKCDAIKLWQFALKRIHEKRRLKDFFRDMPQMKS
jgi:hypothetical protein